jgi:hypothetical protein
MFRLATPTTIMMTTLTLNTHGKCVPLLSVTTTSRSTVRFRRNDLIFMCIHMQKIKAFEICGPHSVIQIAASAICEIWYISVQSTRSVDTKIRNVVTGKPRDLKSIRANPHVRYGRLCCTNTLFQTLLIALCEISSLYNEYKACWMLSHNTALAGVTIQRYLLSQNEYFEKATCIL